jgi:hypothetical protein
MKKQMQFHCLVVNTNFPHFEKQEEILDTRIESIALWMMHKAGVPIDRGDVIPDKFKTQEKEYIMGGYHTDEKECYTGDRNTDMFDPSVENENICEIDNDDCNNKNTPTLPTNPLRKQKKDSTNQEHYGRLLAQMKDNFKVCKGDEDLWNYCHNSLNDILLQVP